MRFAILGDHPDGWRMARALVTSGRHLLHSYQGPTPAEKLAREWPALRVTTDLEDLLADPQVEAVIVAGKPDERLGQLRRVLQSERPALCVHPVDRKPDGAHEMNLLQGDVHQVVLPLLPEAVHPDVEEFKQRIDARLGEPLLIELTVSGHESLLLEGDDLDPDVSFPGWTLLRRLGGEIVEVAGYAVAEEVRKGEIVLGQGRFECGCLLRVLYRPLTINSEKRIDIGGTASDFEPLRLMLTGSALHEPAWPVLVRHFEEAVEQLKATPRAVPGAGPAPPPTGRLSWQDEVRALELDDATRRSIERRRASTLEYQEASEDVGFKGTMTLVGCALLWLIPVLLLVASWFPQLAWLIVPVLLGFLGLQLLRWLVPAPPPSDDQTR